MVSPSNHEYLISSPFDKLRVSGLISFVDVNISAMLAAYQLNDGRYAQFKNIG